MAAMSSTASVLRMLRDRAELEAIHGRMTMATLLMQDAALLPAILIVTALRGGGGFVGAVTTIGVAFGLAGAMVAVFFLLFRWVAPRVLQLRPLARNRELPILMAVVMALGAALAAHALHLSPAVGAFVAGVILGESAFAAQIRADVASIRTVLLTLFFASIGMLGDPQWVAMHWPLVVTVLLAVVVGKAIVVTGVARVMRLPWSVGIAAGLCLAQVGEFSFVLAELAVMDMGGGEGEGPIPPLIDDHVFNLVISVTILTLLATPYMIAWAPKLERRLRRRFRKGAVAIGEEAGAPGEVEAPPILIIGFGPAGQRVAEALIGRARTRLVIVDSNPRNAKIAERYGLHAVVGDARQVDLLEHAGVHEAIAAVVTLPVADVSREVIELLRRMKPELGIAARARHHVFRWELELAGADLVVDEEDQMGLRLAAEVRGLLRSRDVEHSSGDEHG
jgi:CPA2 family monovalent cation:H+ antiporter-2